MKAIQDIKRQLFAELKKENAFWSYDSASVSADIISDETLIANVLRHLDLAEINLLYKIYPAKKIKKVWIEQLVPEGPYLYTLNRFLAWYYFKAKRPDAYLKSLQTRQIRKITTL